MTPEAPTPPTTATRSLSRGVAWARAFVTEHGATSVATVLAIAACLYVVWLPLSRVTYPPITDLPFHAASMAVLRHYFDPSWGFREQFSLHFMESPYWTFHALGAFFSLFCSASLATRLAIAAMLLLLPAGLAVLFRGLGKSPFLALASLPLVWNKLTHWGFINFVGAIGLYAGTVGIALMLMRRPTRARSVLLGAALFLVFATHIFRYPFALAAVLGAAVAMSPATGNGRRVLLPAAPSLLAFVYWFLHRPAEQGVQGFQLHPWDLHKERFAEAPGFLFSAIAGPDEVRLATQSGRALEMLAGACLVLVVLEGRFLRVRLRGYAWWLGGVVTAAGAAGGCLWAYLILPMSMGDSWWYVYPREIVAAVVVALALLPDLPRSWLLRAPLLGWVVYNAALQSRLVGELYADFETNTADFRAILTHIPKAPRLGYMVYDHSGSLKTDTPYLHLPAWVQAERGGALSFHFVSWNVLPIRYRKDSPAVPPPTPTRFEWMPEAFDVQTRGKFFNWFLVRSQGSMEHRFAVDPEIQQVAHEGTWWLYARVPAKAAAAAPNAPAAPTAPAATAERGQ
jgi:hypothetical protein